MKKAVSIFFIFVVCFFSCSKKQSSSSSSSTKTTVANSTLTVGGPCWTYDSCKVNTTSGNYSLTGYCSTTTVQLVFSGNSITVGSYAATSGIPAAGQVLVKIINPPSQAPGTWGPVGPNSGVAVTTGTIGYMASFVNMNTQSSISGPTVTASGTVICY